MRYILLILLVFNVSCVSTAFKKQPVKTVKERDRIPYSPMKIDNHRNNTTQLTV